MGMSYDVDTKLVFTDRNLFCEIIKNEYDERELDSYYKPNDFADPFECFKSITSGVHCEMYEDGEYSAWFDASYGWESVLLDVFTASMDAVADGSTIKIYPDNAVHVLKKVNGKVEHKFIDYD